MKLMFDNWTKLFALLAVACATGMNVTAEAAVVFMDTFDRETEFDLNGSMTGITNNTGNAFAGGVYGNGFVDPAYPGGGASGGAGDGGSAKIHENELRLAVGPGTSNAFVNHNFVNLGSKVFSVSLDLTGYDGGAGSGHGGGFAIGMSEAEALSTGDAQNGNTGAGDGDFKMQDGLQDGGNQVSDVAVSDFWAVLRGDGFLQVGTKGHNFPASEGVFGPGHLNSIDVGANTGTIKAVFYAPDFNDGTSVQYRLFFNDQPIDIGSFVWTGTDENYIGIDARHGSYVSFDNFTVSVPEPSTAVLTLLAVGAGIVCCRRKS
ncbi:PEP-CTERM sorting domain-containing protein [Aeoliella sp. ICT_H6.2]|uniref:PEP-CTERM sorting domain-containing protein n=1 Tax=Aeoliella straminimaris TaxID=2954799 RepID=A0A9X2JKQ6_9BACT|nr:PEP-CTERM sorting domain-containing protein [Aeoliella straminimaris]MCO6047129.1 PEP-CTERM sorting domain-containing protein [Aeoliella straminimaris]